VLAWLYKTLPVHTVDRCVYELGGYEF